MDGLRNRRMGGWAREKTLNNLEDHTLPADPLK